MFKLEFDWSLNSNQYSLDTLEMGLNKNKKSFIEYLKKQGIISDAQARNMGNLPLQNLLSDYSEEYSKFNSQIVYKGDMPVLFPENDSEKEEISEDEEQDLLRSLDEADNDASYLTLDDIEAEYGKDIKKYQTEKKLSVEDIDSYTSTDKLLKDIYQDEDIMAVIDEDKDGKISDEEKAKFESYTKGENEKLELNDLKDVCKDIKNGEFDTDEYGNYKIPDKNKLKEEEKADKAKSASSAGGGGGGGVSGGGSTPSKSDNNTPTGPLDNKTADELAKMRDDKKSDINKASDALEGIQNNTDSEVAKKKEEVNDAKQDYLDKLEEAENISDETKAEIKDNLEQIDEAENAIAETTSEITDCQTQMDVLQSDIDIKDQTIQTYDANITAISTQITTDEAQKTAYENELSSISSDDKEGDSKKKNIEAQIKALGEKIDAENTQKAAYEEQKAVLEQEKEDLITQKDELESTKMPELNEKLEEKQKELEELQNKKQELDEKVLNDPEVAPEVKDALNKSNQIKLEFEALKQSKIADAQKTLNNEKAELTTISNKYNEVKEKETQSDTNKVTSVNGKYLETLFKNGLNMKTEWVQGNENQMSYLAVCPEGIDPNEEKPVMVVLHGADEFGDMEKAIENMTLVQVMIGGEKVTMSGQDIAKWDGYVLFPQAQHGAWTEDAKMQQVTDVLDRFSQNHNIDKSNISVVGLSAGGAGALYFADKYNTSQDTYTLTSCTTFGSTPYNNLSNIKIPVHSYYGSGDNGDFGQQLKNSGNENIDVTYLSSQRWHLDMTSFTCEQTNGVPAWLMKVQQDLSRTYKI